MEQGKGTGKSGPRKKSKGFSKPSKISKFKKAEKEERAKYNVNRQLALLSKCLYAWACASGNLLTIASFRVGLCGQAQDTLNMPFLKRGLASGLVTTDNNAMAFWHALSRPGRGAKAWIGKVVNQ